ncbi:hypothetical protein HALDL1_05110 [Halobacterium sp. DL1]|nr:hypothetical protein HALDL1_05110 [Halobacterium sp. DL1]
MRPWLRRCGALALAVLFVTSASFPGVAPSAVGQASAGDWVDTCTVGPEIVAVFAPPAPGTEAVS